MANSNIKKTEIAARKMITSKLSYAGNQTFLALDERIPLRNADIKRIVLLRQDRIGDLIISLPFLARLRAHFPHAVIDIVLGKNQSAARYARPFVDNILCYGPDIAQSLKVIHTLRWGKYDLLIDMLDTSSSTSSILTKACHATIKMGFDKENAHVYSHIIPLPDRSTFHISYRLASIFSFIGIKRLIADDMNLNAAPLIHIGGDNRKKAADLLGKTHRTGPNRVPRIGFVLSGSTDEKYLGPEKIITLIDGLRKRGFDACDIVLFGTPNLIEDLELIRIRVNANDSPNRNRNAPKPRLIRYAPISSDFYLFVAMLATCNMIVSPDTSAIHLAAELRIPVVAYYNLSPDPKAPMPWYPYKGFYKSIITNNGIKSIDNDEIISKIIDLAEYIFPELVIND
jgi:ADP-heptose:LPS heptosyltransferase